MSVSPFSTSYVEPKQPTKYLKLSEGVHVFRILTPKEEVLSYFIEYLEDTNDQGQPIKRRIVTPDNGDGKQPVGSKRNWSFKVWNHEFQTVQVWECSQKSIQEALANIARGKIKNDWTKYDIQITRTGQMMETEYSLVTDDTSELVEEVNKIIDSTYVNLEALLTNDDPFLPEKAQV